MSVKCRINGYDAYSKWGVIIPDTSVSGLLAFAPLKAYITNKSRLMDGDLTACGGGTTPKVDSRDLTLVLYIKARNLTQFNQRLNAFETELRKGGFTLWVAERPNDYYRLLYQSCSQFTQFNGRLAKFTLRVQEPDPTDRAATPKERILG